MIIILGNNKDEHCMHVASELSKIKEDSIFLDTKLFPKNIIINWYADLKNKGYIKINDKKIDFENIKGIYWRNFSEIKYEEIYDGENTEFLSTMIQRERDSAIKSLFYSLDINWVNSINAFELHKKKAYITNLLRANNIRVPKTLITNDKEDVYNFLELNNNQIIVKPVLGGAYTEKLTKDSITEERLETLKISPVQFQEFIDGYDIRVYAFKDKIYAFKIEANTVDFREDLDAKLVCIELPEYVKQDCIKVMKLLDLKYTGIDIRHNTNGEYVFIEANPAPMFLYAEKVTGLPLTKSLINILINEHACNI